MELLELYRATLLITLNWPCASLKIQKSFIISKNVLSTSLFDETSIQSLCGFSNLTWHWYCPLDQEVSSVNLVLHFLLWDWNFLPTDSITLPFSCNSFMLLHFVSSLTLYPFAVCLGLPFLQSCKTNALSYWLFSFHQVLDMWIILGRFIGDWSSSLCLDFMFLALV